MPKISACMIIFNEEQNITKCLDSFKSYVDEIIIVDTGSTDETLKLIEEWNSSNYPRVKLFKHSWNDSFADMRNISLDYATGEYIFIIDGDEILLNFSFKPGSDYYICRVRLQEKDRHFDMETIRLFKNCDSIRFHGTRHATVDLAVKDMNGNKADVLTLHPELSEEELDSKVHNNILKHLEQINSEPDNHSIKYHLSNCYRYIGDIQNAIDFGLLALLSPLNINLKALKCNELYLMYNDMGKTTIGLEFLKYSIQLQPMQIMARAILMQIALKENNKEVADTQFSIIKQIINNKSSQLPTDFYYTDEELKNLRRINYAG